MTDDIEIEPLNEDEPAALYMTNVLLSFEENADVIAEIIDSDPNRVFCMNWRNASITMRAGTWAAIFQRELMAETKCW